MLQKLTYLMEVFYLIHRGTTPTHIFVLPFDLDTIANIIVTYRQNGCNVLQKTMENNFDDIIVDMDARKFGVRLTQSDTRVFTCGPKYKNNIIQIQLKILFENDSVMLSDVISDRVVNTSSDDSISDSNNKFSDTHIIYDGGSARGTRGSLRSELYKKRRKNVKTFNKRRLPYVNRGYHPL